MSTAGTALFLKNRLEVGAGLVHAAGAQAKLLRDDRPSTEWHGLDCRRWKAIETCLALWKAKFPIRIANSMGRHPALLRPIQCYGGGAETRTPDSADMSRML